MDSGLAWNDFIVEASLGFLTSLLDSLSNKFELYIIFIVGFKFSRSFASFVGHRRRISGHLFIVYPHLFCGVFLFPFSFLASSLLYPLPFASFWKVGPGPISIGGRSCRGFLRNRRIFLRKNNKFAPCIGNCKNKNVDVPMTIAIK